MITVTLKWMFDTFQLLTILILLRQQNCSLLVDWRAELDEILSNSSLHWASFEYGS